MRYLLFWRTVIAVLALGLMTLAPLVLMMLLSMPPWVPGIVSAMYPAFAGAMAGLAVVLGSKSTVEHLAGGGGVKGAVAALMTSAKPEGAQPDAPQQVQP